MDTMLSRTHLSTGQDMIPVREDPTLGRDKRTDEDDLRDGTRRGPL